MTVIVCAASIVALIVFITGRTSLAELFGQDIGPVVAGAGVEPVMATAAAPAGGAAPATSLSPCEQLVQSGFDCTGKGLLDAVAANNRTTIPLYVASGVDGSTRVSPGGPTVLETATQMKASGVGFLVAEMLAAKTIDGCDALELVALGEVTGENACRVWSSNSCQAKFRDDLARKAEPEAERLDKNFRAITSSVESCANYYAGEPLTGGRGYPYWLSDVSFPTCDYQRSTPKKEACETEGWFSRESALDYGPRCFAIGEDEFRACYRKACEANLSGLKARFPDAKAFRVAFSEAALKLDRLETIARQCR